MKKQTAVEWLFNKINSDEYTHAFGKTYISSVFLDEALKIEKEQIKRAFIDGEQNVWDRHKNKHEFEFDTVDQYYNEKYQNTDMPEIEKLTQDLSIFEVLAAMLRPK